MDNNLNIVSERKYYGTISALHIIGDYLLNACGNRLKINNIKNNQTIYEFQIFDNNKITKIRSVGSLVFIIGETKIYLFNLNNSNIENQKFINTNSNDYILDANIYMNNLILGFVNNFIELYDNQIYNKTIFCKDRCIIYSMSSYIHKDNLIIASGTVFKNIVIWIVNHDDIIKSFNLYGHEGVIFNIQFNDFNHLLSVSDDRTAKYWTIDYDNQKFEFYSFIGHSARVWDARIFNNILTSVGEDSIARVYNLETNKFIKDLVGHVGKSIRSIEMNEEYIFTGGDDNLILNWEINKILYGNIGDLIMLYELDENNQQCNKARMKQKNFSPSIKVLYFTNNFLLIGTNHGEVLLLDYITSSKIKCIFNDPECRVINSIIYIEEKETFIVGLSDGCICVIDEKISFFKIFKNMRVSFMSYKFINNYIFIFISDALGITNVYLNENIIKFDKFTTINTGNKYKLPVSSIELIKINGNEYVIFLGDYNGTVNFTKLKIISDNIYTFGELKGIKLHLSEKVTILKFYNNYLYSCGRDGSLKKLKYANNTIIEITNRNVNNITSFEYFDDNIIVGHHGRDLFFYDINRKIIFHTNDVKGINRPFDIVRNEEYIYYAFSFNKSLSLIKLNYKPNFSINTQTHGKLIHTNCVCKIKNSYIILTGSEDTKINIYLYKEELKLMEQITRHISAIRKICIIELDEESETVTCASVGASSECFVFKIDVKNFEISFLFDLSIKNENLETRNMSISSIKLKNNNYFLVYSNSLGNSYCYSIDLISNKSELIHNLHLDKSKFIALCLDITFINNLFIFYGLTNGHITYHKLLDNEIKENSFKIHEAGINSISINNNKIYTCGEDNSICISLIQNDNIYLLTKYKQYHSSSIKSLKLNNNILVTAGYDQKLNIFNIKENEIYKQTTINTCIAEINNLDFINEQDIFIVTVGQGIEIFKI